MWKKSAQICTVGVAFIVVGVLLLPFASAEVSDTAKERKEIVSHEELFVSEDFADMADENGTKTTLQSDNVGGGGDQGNQPMSLTSFIMNSILILGAFYLTAFAITYSGLFKGTEHDEVLQIKQASIS